MNRTLNEVRVTYKKKYVCQEEINSSLKCWNLFKKIFNKNTIELVEEMNVLLLDNGNHPIGIFKASTGGTNSTIVDLKLILSTALKCMAHSIIISHNHPSGNLKPSNADLKCTSDLKNGCEMVGIRLLDHIIISNNDEYFSFADSGLI